MRQQLQRGLKNVSALIDRVRPPAHGITILIYHRVGARTTVPVDLPRSLFRDQIASIADRAITLDAALGELEAAAAGGYAGSVNRNPVVVTFDDGTADIVEEALPILVEHGVSALLYLATDFVERKRSFPDEGRPVSWAALADAVSTGFLQIGSHTHTHTLLDRVDETVVVDELDRSIELIGERLGVEARHFAYPKALPGSPAADSAVRQRFVSAALAGTRANRPGRTDPWRLSRSPIQVSDGLEWFEKKVDGGLALEDSVRRTVNRVRYRGATR